MMLPVKLLLLIQNGHGLKINNLQITRIFSVGGWCILKVIIEILFNNYINKEKEACFFINHLE